MHSSGSKQAGGWTNIVECEHGCQNGVCIIPFIEGSYDYGADYLRTSGSGFWSSITDWFKRLFRIG